MSNDNEYLELDSKKMELQTKISGIISERLEIQDKLTQINAKLKGMGKGAYSSERIKEIRNIEKLNANLSQAKAELKLVNIRMKEIDETLDENEIMRVRKDIDRKNDIIKYLKAKEQELDALLPKVNKLREALRPIFSLALALKDENDKLLLTFNKSELWVTDIMRIRDTFFDIPQK